MSAPATGLLDHLSLDEREIFFRFLILIRDNYPKADKAAYFLERRAGVAKTCSIANLRDVLSHLATLLDPTTPLDHRRDQLADAEEHLRRAIIEPYELALGSLTEKFSPVYDTYREKLIPIREFDGFRAAPNVLAINARLEEIDALAEKGKRAKARNRWDEEWEAGIAALIDAYNKLSDLHYEVEEWVFKAGQHRETSRHTSLHWWGIGIGVGGIIVGALIAWLK